MPAEIKKEIQLEIAHVLVMDIVGYSKLSINDQLAAIVLHRPFGSAMISNADSTLFIYSKTHQNAHRNNTRASITRRAKVLRDNP